MYETIFLYPSEVLDMPEETKKPWSDEATERLQALVTDAKRCNTAEDMRALVDDLCKLLVLTVVQLRRQEKRIETLEAQRKLKAVKA